MYQNEYGRQACRNWALWHNGNMLIPQYTIRWMLGLMTVCAVVFSIFAAAMRGNQAAIGVSVAILALVVLLLVHAGMFGLVWLFSVVTAGWLGHVGESEESVPVNEKDIPAAPIIQE
jgi:hypothetical protein